MSDEGTPQKSDSTGNPPNNDALVQKNTELAGQVVEMKAQLEALTGERDSLKTANEQANAKVADLAEQVKQFTAQLEAKSGELTNWQTQHQQVTEQIGSLAGENARLAKQMEVVNLIAGNGDYHSEIASLPDLMELVGPDTDVSKIENLIKSRSTATQAQIDKTLDMFKAGGTVPAGSGTKPGQSGPKSVEEAWAQMQAINPRVEPGRYRQLQQFILAAQDQQNQPPN